MLRKELDILFRDGFLALSKTRYCVGQGRVGLAQIPGQLTATRRVASRWTVYDWMLNCFVAGCCNECEIARLLIMLCSREE